MSKNQIDVSAISSKLIEDGYPDYAMALNGFETIEPAVPGQIGYTDYRSLYLKPDLKLEEMCLVTRHEILHVLLEHKQQEEELEAMIGTVNHRQANVYMDLELSNFYSNEDNNLIKNSDTLQGSLYVGSDDYAQYKNQYWRDLYLKDPEGVSRQGNGGIGDDFSPSEDLKKRLQEAVEEELKKLTPEKRKEIEDKINDLFDKKKNPSASDCKPMDEDGEDFADGKSMQGTGETITPPKPVSPDRAFLNKLAGYFLEEIEPDNIYVPIEHHELGCFLKEFKFRRVEGRTLAVYVDVSGSMSEDKLSRARGCVSRLREIENLTLKEFFFDTEISDQFHAGGGTDYNIVVQHANNNNYTDICIITDDTPESFINHAKFSSVWLIGVEGDVGDKYSIYKDANKPSGIKTAKIEHTILTFNG